MKTKTPLSQPINDADASAGRPAYGAGAGTAADGSTGLRSLVHGLIAFGQALLLTLRSAPTAAMVSAIGSRFGSVDIALLIARITRGLMLAANLDARLLRSADRRDGPVTGPAALDMPAASSRRPRAARVPALTGAADDAALLAHLPTAQEIAARLRGKPIGVVLEQICHDLGITCDHKLWRALQRAIIANGGNLARVFNAMSQRVAAGYDPALDLSTALPYPGSDAFVAATRAGPS